MPKLKLNDITVKNLEAPARGQVDYWDALLPAFGLRIGVSGKKTWIVSARVLRLGEWLPPRRISLGRYPAVTLAAAREKAQEALRLASDGKDPRAVAKVDRQKIVDDSRNTFAVVRKKFLQAKAAANRRETTLYDYKLILESNDLKSWHDRAVTTITRAHVKDALRQVEARGARVMANRLQAVLSSFFSWAADEEIIPVSPIAAMKKRHDEVSRDRAPSGAELVEIWQAAEAIGWPFGPAVQLLIFLAQRKEETGRLRWSEINLKEGLWTLPGARTKNGQPFDIHLAPGVVTLLRALPRVTNKDGKEVDWIFSTTGENPVSGWGRAKERLDAKILERRRIAAVEAGEDPEQVAPMEPWVLHDLRRSFATGCGDLGVAEHVADRCLNHVARKKGGVARIYNRALYSAERKAAMVLWANHVQGLLARASGTNVVLLKNVTGSNAA